MPENIHICHWTCVTKQLQLRWTEVQLTADPFIIIIIIIQIYHYQHKLLTERLRNFKIF